MSGFVWLERKTPVFPNQQLVNIGEFNRQHGSSKIDEDRNLSELDKLRAKAEKGNLW
jgi:hypothetical protein